MSQTPPTAAAGAERRTTSRIVRDIPPDVRRELDRLVVEKALSIDQLVEWLNGRVPLAEPISRSAMGRYTQQFDAKLESIAELQAKATAIVGRFQEGGGGGDLDDASRLLAVNLVMKRLLEIDALDEDTDPIEMMNALAKLHTASSKREAVRMTARRAVELAGRKIKDELRKAVNADKDLAARLCGIVDEQVEVALKEAA